MFNCDSWPGRLLFFLVVKSPRMTVVKKKRRPAGWADLAIGRVNPAETAGLAPRAPSVDAPGKFPLSTRVGRFDKVFIIPYWRLVQFR